MVDSNVVDLGPLRVFSPGETTARALVLALLAQQTNQLSLEVNQAVVAEEGLLFPADFPTESTGKLPTSILGWRGLEF